MHERKIAYRPAFLRDVKRLKNKHYDTNTLKTALQAVAARRTDWLNPHRDPHLTGNLTAYRELHIASDWLLLYTIDNDNTLTLARTGTHDQLL